jgi:hypothetical protein
VHIGHEDGAYDDEEGMGASEGGAMFFLEPDITAILRKNMDVRPGRQQEHPHLTKLMNRGVPFFQSPKGDQRSALIRMNSAPNLIQGGVDKDHCCHVCYPCYSRVSHFKFSDDEEGMSGDECV